MDEIDAIKERYQRRKKTVPANKYALTNPHILMSVQEKERKLVKMLSKNGLLPLKDRQVLEIGCGTGFNLTEFLRFGASPENIVGNDLLENRLATARASLPDSVKLICCDASELKLQPDSFDIILQSTVFTSILDDHLQVKLANTMWSLLKPGGFIIWYDFTVANPYNPDVRPMPVRKVKELFPHGEFQIRRLTLYPFLSKAVTKKFYFLYSFLNIWPFLRMHALCFIEKAN